MLMVTRTAGSGKQHPCHVVTDPEAAGGHGDLSHYPSNKKRQESWIDNRRNSHCYVSFMGHFTGSLIWNYRQ